ncbi:MAG TPA: toxin-antitoxin system protein [Thermoanaerobaculia bacterium]|nr:toxin-antitoxin system protein [Thermoanaerobaculia bacterium]
MSTATVRIRQDTHRTLREIASRTGRSLPDILEEAVETLRRQSFLEGLAADFAALREDPESWQEELEERAAWDGTLGDDLERD